MKKYITTKWYSDKEEKLLLGDKSYQELSALLNRSIKSLRAKRFKLKNHINKGIKLRRFTEKENKLILNYKLSLSDIALKLNCKKDQVRIKRSNLRQTRFKSKIKSHYSTNGKLNRKFFDTWSHDSAYIAGFTCADGYFNETNRYLLGWTLHKRDKEILEKFKKILKSGLKIRKIKKDFVRLEISCKEFIQSFKMHGMPTSRKTSRINIPNIPEKYMPDFVRGFFDGDGCIYFKRRKDNSRTDMSIEFTSASKCFLTNLRSIFINILNIHIPETRKRSNANAYRFRVSGWKTIVIGKWMYNGSKLYLKRKKKIWNCAFKYKFVRVHD